MSSRRSDRQIAIREIQIAAQICALRRLAIHTTFVFARERQTGLSRAEVAAQMLGVLDEQQQRDRD
jgi:hypothetical protein